MGKTVKSRAIMSIVSFALVLVLCFAANASIPSLYESYKQRVVAQEAATKEAEEIKKPANADKSIAPAQQTDVPAAPAEEDAAAADDFSSEEDSNVYDVPEEAPAEEAPAEESEEDLEDFDFDFGETDKDNNDKKEENKGGFFDVIFSAIKGIFEKISNLKIFKFFKDLIAKFLGLFGITL